MTKHGMAEYNPADDVDILESMFAAIDEVVKRLHALNRRPPEFDYTNAIVERTKAISDAIDALASYSPSETPDGNEVFCLAQKATNFRLYELHKPGLANVRVLEDLDFAPAYAAAIIFASTIVLHYGLRRKASLGVNAAG